jgi:glycosyltransferase involved in cell wall biosynthesis
MPVYNEAGFLATAIESILSQTFTSFELIIIDDNSDDGSRSIAEEYAVADCRISLIVHRQNRGNYPSRNEGMDMAQGEFIAVMDADDISKPHRLERQAGFLDSHPSYSMVGSRVLLIDADGDPLGPMEGIPLKHEAIDAALMDGRWAVIHPSVMIRMEAIQDIGGYRERFRRCADHDMYLRLAENSRVANLPEKLLYYRRHYGSMTLNKVDQPYNLRIIQRDARERRNLPPLDVELPSVQEKEQMSQRDKVLAELRWARLAGHNLRFKTFYKHIINSLCLGPIVTAKEVCKYVTRLLSLLYRRYKTSN